MKHFKYLWLIPLFFGLSACSKDDEVLQTNNSTTTKTTDQQTDYNKNTGKNNTVDIAVTGDAVVTEKSATIKGYINIEQKSLPELVEFGVEYWTGYGPKERAKVDGYSGREFTIYLRNLKPNTTYNYRTYVTMKMDVYGETLTFTTKQISTSVDNITYTSAEILCPENNFYLYYSTKPDGEFTMHKGEYENEPFYYGAVLNNLKPNTTYYYYTVVNGVRTETQSFSTKSINLSGVNISVSAKPSLATNEYANFFADVTFTITSNLGTILPQSQLKYGACVNASIMYYYYHSTNTYFEEEKYVYYSNNMSSPFKVAFSYSLTSDFEAKDQIRVLAQKIAQYDATPEDYEMYDMLLDECHGCSCTLDPFVEIDGERIYLGRSYSNTEIAQIAQ